MWVIMVYKPTNITGGGPSCRDAVAKKFMDFPHKKHPGLNVCKGLDFTDVDPIFFRLFDGENDWVKTIKFMTFYPGFKPKTSRDEMYF